MGYKNKEDQAKAARRHYDLNKEKLKARAKAHDAIVRPQLQALILEYLRNNPCVDCGESDPIVLEFDHLDPTLKKGNISYLVSMCVAKQTLTEEISKCEVVCCNCHRRRTYIQFGHNLKDKSKG